MTEPLDVDQVRETLREIVADFPDGYRYDGVTWHGGKTCVYALDGQPSCLIGHLFHRLNIVIPEWHQTSTVSRVVPGYASGMFTRDAVVYMAAVQQAQDDLVPWAQALEMGDDLVIDLKLGRTDDVVPEATL